MSPTLLRILVKAARDAVKPNHKWLSRKRNAAGELVYTYHQGVPKRRKAMPGTAGVESQAEMPTVTISEAANDSAIRALRRSPASYGMRVRTPKMFSDYTDQERVKQKEEIESRLARRLCYKDSVWAQTPHTRKEVYELASKFVQDRKVDVMSDGSQMADYLASPVHTVCRWLVDSWAATSADHRAIALALQMAAAEVFDLDEVATDHLGHVKNADSNLSVQRLQADVHHILDQHRPLLHAFLRAQYDETQEHFRAMDVKEVTLYRGFTYRRADGNIPDWAAHVDDNGIVMPVQLQPMSSFGAEYDACIPFATGGVISSAMPDLFAGFMMGITVPADRIIGTCRTGFGCLTESEMVVLGGVYDSFVSKIDKPSELPEPSEWLDGTTIVTEDHFIKRAKKAKVWTK